jgi:D-glycero-alpha-D-manno-heptose 1-phosphate guanylyltransferase
MEAVILCGGLGTRLRPVLADRPKCLAPVKGKTYLDYLTTFMERQGIQRIIFATGHFSEQVNAWVQKEKRSWEYAISKEETMMGTGGALRLAAMRVSSPNFLAFNGDTFLDADCRKLLESHTTWRADVTLCVLEVPDTVDYGRLEMEQNKVKHFNEKGISGAGIINTGAYAIRKDFILQFPLKPFSFEKEILMQTNAEIFGFRVYGHFLDIGTPTRLELINTILPDTE